LTDYLIDELINGGLMKYNNFEELPIWQNAGSIVNQVYCMIENNSKLQEDLRLSGQLIGASVSIMNNIAEGFDVNPVIL
jgi:23S rRNA-intervening sequence protein